MRHARAMALRAPACIPTDLRPRLETARLDLLALFRALDRMDLPTRGSARAPGSRKFLTARLLLVERAASPASRGNRVIRAARRRAASARAPAGSRRRTRAHPAP